MDDQGFYYLFSAISILIPMLASTVGVFFVVIAAIIGAIISLIIHYIEAIPVYKIAKKHGVSHAAIALIPIQPCIIFVLASIPGEREIDFFGQWKNKLMTAILIYFGVYLAAPTLTAVGGIIGIIPIVAMNILEYLFLKDVIDLYNPTKNTNNTTAVIVTITSYLTGGLVRGIYLWNFLKKEPCTQNIHAEYSEVEN